MNVPQVGSSGIDTQSAARLRVDGHRTAQPASTGAADALHRGAPVELAPAAGEQAPAQKPTSAQLKEAVNEINRAMRQSNRALEFSVDEDTDRLIVRLKDGETGETIRQFPSDETLAIARYIADVQQGLLISQKA
jgi:flagellar protein FlaG